MQMYVIPSLKDLLYSLKLNSTDGTLPYEGHLSQRKSWAFLVIITNIASKFQQKSCCFRHNFNIKSYLLCWTDSFPGRINIPTAYTVIDHGPSRMPFYFAILKDVRIICRNSDIKYDLTQFCFRDISVANSQGICYLALQ